MQPSQRGYPLGFAQKRSPHDTGQRVLVQNAWWWVWWWWYSRCVLLIRLSIPANVLHLILGEPCPCGHHSPGPAPVCRAQKKSPHQLITVTMSCTQRVSRQVQLWEHDCLHDGTCGTRSTCTPGTSITVSKSNWGISMVNETMGISLCITTGMSCTTGTTRTSITVSSNWGRCVCRQDTD